LLLQRQCGDHARPDRLPINMPTRTLYIDFAPSAYNQVELSTLVNGGMHEWLRATGLH
jgi:hypothetical protein